MAVIRNPNSNLVLERLLGRILGTEDHSARDLPEDQSKWTESGFMTYTNLGGPGALELPSHATGYRLSAWATTGATGASKSPPWAKAFDLAGRVYDGLQGVKDPDFYAVHPTRSGYAPHKVITAYPTSDPMDIGGDPSGFARVDFSVMIQWTAVPS